MKAMLGLVTIVAIIATTGAYIPEYNDADVYAFSTADPEAEVSTAKVLNSNVELKFRVSDTPTEEGIALIPESLPDEEGSAKNGCGVSPGVHVTNIGKSFCNVSYFLLAVDSFDVDYSTEENASESSTRFAKDSHIANKLSAINFGRSSKPISYHFQKPSLTIKNQLGLSSEFYSIQEEILQLSLYFDNGGKPFLIEIPVFKVPSELEAADQVVLQNWANENEVGIASPVNNQTLNDLNEKGELKGDFEWLSDLVSFGIVPSEDSYHLTETDTHVEAYTARPIVLSGEMINKLIQLINKYKKKIE